MTRVLFLTSGAMSVPPPMGAASKPCSSAAQMKASHSAGERKQERVKIDPSLARRVLCVVLMRRRCGRDRRIFQGGTGRGRAGPDRSGAEAPSVHDHHLGPLARIELLDEIGAPLEHGALVDIPFVR